jgi:YVTN family beta-propeller protein
MAFTADGSKLYVACSRSNDVSVIDTSSYKRIGSIAVGGQPSAIVIRNRPNLPRDGG